MGSGSPHSRQATAQMMPRQRHKWISDVLLRRLNVLLRKRARKIMRTVNTGGHQTNTSAGKANGDIRKEINRVRLRLCSHTGYPLIDRAF